MTIGLEKQGDATSPFLIMSGRPAVSASMPVPMMHIRKMRMAMPHHTVYMHMTMRLCRVPLKPMLMLMMLIMHVPVP
ncbi:hypothetical protein ROS62_30600, partial [Streptomyces sp. DSM 41972]|nr:hypothetical protein [Streptomyces sp. DSM 41972]